MPKNIIDPQAQVALIGNIMKRIPSWVITVGVVGSAILMLTGVMTPIPLDGVFFSQVTGAFTAALILRLNDWFKTTDKLS